MPLISIIIPVYNVEAYLHKCVNSVLDQDFKDIEVLLVDDGSPDNCPIICDAFANKDARVKVIHKKNGGLSDARNKGIKSATGEYLMFLDSDDYWIGNTHLTKISKIILSNKVDTILLRCIHFYEDGNVFVDRNNNKRIQKEMDSNLILFNLIKNGNQASSACLRIVKRNIIIDNNIFFVNHITGEDSEWFIHLSFYIKNYYEYDESFYAYRQNREGSITSNLKKKNFEDQFFIIDNWYDKINLHNVDHILQKGLNGFLAYLLSVSILNVYRLENRADRITVIKDINKRIGILKYSLNPKAKIVFYMCRFLGVKNAAIFIDKIFKLVEIHRSKRLKFKG